MKHPAGIQPEGNLLFSAGSNCRDSGLGTLAILSDALLLDILGYLGARDLCQLSRASKALYAFCDHEELWKALVLEEYGGSKWEWHITWRGSYARTAAAASAATAAGGADHIIGHAGAHLHNGNAHALTVTGQSSQGASVQDREREHDKQEQRDASAPAPKGSKKGKKRQQEAGNAPGEASKENGNGGVAENGRSKRQKRGSTAGTADREGNGTAASSKTLNTKQGRGKKQLEQQDVEEEPTGVGHEHDDEVQDAVQEKRDWCEEGPETRPLIQRAVQVSDFYSDLLFQPWHCATCEIQKEWLEVENVDRRSGLTPEQFRQEYELPNRPVVLTDGASHWAALKKWSVDYLAKAFAGRTVIAGSFNVPVETYLQYASSTWDEMPLYLFDKKFVAAAPQLAGDFDVPDVFSEDLFSVLGDSRPDYRWLIVGPRRSGSSFHIDPNATSAWNAVVTGAKKWILFPPHVTPPGVHPSVDGADVATPVSLIEWFLNFYDDARNAKVAPLECVVGPGEVMYVPSGWWHACLNLDTMTVAVTQNFVSSVNLPKVLSFLRPGRAELVSGCAPEQRSQLHDRFVSALRESHPDILAAVEAKQAAARQRAEQAHRLSRLFRGPSATPEPETQAAAATGGSQQEGSPAPRGTKGNQKGHSLPGVRMRQGGLPSHMHHQQECSLSRRQGTEAEHESNSKATAACTEQQAAGGDSATGSVAAAPSMGFSFGFKL